MFANKLLSYLKKPSVYKLRRMQPLQNRKKVLEEQLRLNPGLMVGGKNLQYKEAFEVIIKEKENTLMKYQKSILWSPRYTPQNFINRFLIPAFFVTLLLLYIRYIAQPKHMLKLKLKYGIKMKELEDRGWLDAWLDQYHPPDEVLTFEAYSLKDIEILHKQGLLPGATPDQKAEQETRAKKRKGKFMSGEKDFMMKDFKSN